MSAPSKVLNLQLVEIQPTQRLTTGVEATIALHEMANAVKPMEGRHQAAMQVKTVVLMNRGIR